MRRFLRIAVLLAIVAAVAAVIAITGRPRVHPVEEAAWAWTRGRMAELGAAPETYRIRSVAIVSQTDDDALVGIEVDGTPRRNFLVSLVHGTTGWRFSADLYERFNREIYESPEEDADFRRRLAQAVQEQTRGGVTVPETLPRTLYIEVVGQTPTARLQATFQTIVPDPPPEDDPNHVTLYALGPGEEGGGCYIETWTWRDGRWQNEGAGSLLRGVPRRPQ